jgi:hypothetical protein
MATGSSSTSSIALKDKILVGLAALGVIALIALVT